MTTNSPSLALEGNRRKENSQDLNIWETKWDEFYIFSFVDFSFVEYLPIIGIGHDGEIGNSNLEFIEI